MDLIAAFICIFLPCIRAINSACVSVSVVVCRKKYNQIIIKQWQHTPPVSIRRARERERESNVAKAKNYSSNNIKAVFSIHTNTQIKSNAKRMICIIHPVSNKIRKVPTT